MLAHCLREWTNMKPALAQRPVFAGDDLSLAWMLSRNINPCPARPEFTNEVEIKWNSTEIHIYCG